MVGGGYRCLRLCPHTHGCLVFEELSQSLVYQSDKSKKPGLDEERVDKERVKQMMRLVEKRFGAEEWSEKTLIAKANQKCRDSKPIVIN